LGDATPDSRFHPDQARALSPGGRVPAPRAPQRDGDAWVSRKVADNGIVCVGYQQVRVGQNYSGSPCDVSVTGDLLQFWVGNQLVKTAACNSDRPIRNKHAAGNGPRSEIPGTECQGSTETDPSSNSRKRTGAPRFCR
jgi:hypothetical protein